MGKFIKTLALALVVGFAIFYLYTRPEAAAGVPFDPRPDLFDRFHGCSLPAKSGGRAGMRSGGYARLPRGCWHEG